MCAGSAHQFASPIPLHSISSLRLLRSPLSSPLPLPLPLPSLCPAARSVALRCVPIRSRSSPNEEVLNRSAECSCTVLYSTVLTSGFSAAQHRSLKSPLIDRTCDSSALEPMQSARGFSSGRSFEPVVVLFGPRDPEFLTSRLVSCFSSLHTVECKYSTVQCSTVETPSCSSCPVSFHPFERPIKVDCSAK